MAAQKGMIACLLVFTLVWSTHAGNVFPGTTMQDETEGPGGTPGTVKAAASSATGEATVCPVGLDPLNPDFGKGKDSEGTTYGVAMMQADSSKLTSAANIDNVLFCLVSSGADITNPDIPKGTTGCMPGTSRPGGPIRNCYNWMEDSGFTFGGTSAAAAIGGLKNGVGVAGVMPGAQLYIYRQYNDSATYLFGPILSLLDAYKDCVAELDARNSAKSNNPTSNKSAGSPTNMKLVILTDSSIVAYTDDDTADIMAIQKYIKEVTTARNDVMFIQAAYSYNGNDTFPSAFPEYIAVSAVDHTFTWGGESASTSSWESVGYKPGFSTLPGGPGNWDGLLGADLSAPGVDILVSQPTSGIDSIFRKWNSPYGQPETMVEVSPPLTGQQTDLWDAPLPAPLYPSGIGSSRLIEAPLVSCGIAFNPGAGNVPCADAKGKICLIQRGVNFLGEKVKNCLAGGGVGAVIYGSVDQPECERWSGSLVGNLGNTTGPLPDGTWPVSVGVSRKQGMALLSALEAGNVTTVTLIVAMAKKVDVPLNFVTRNSAAATLAAGAIGMLWSAHPECSAKQIRAAVEATAKQKQDTNQDAGILMKKYGKGLVQVQDAHTYLLANPCKSKPTPVITITTSLPGQPMAFNVTVAVTSASRTAVKGAKVVLQISPNGLATCSPNKSISTNNRGPPIGGAR